MKTDQLLTGKEGFIELCLEKGILPSPDLLDVIKDLEELTEVLSSAEGETFLTPQKYRSFLEPEKQVTSYKGKVRVLVNYGDDSKKRELKNFVTHFTKRYRAISAILAQRPELQNMVSISRLKGRNDNVAFVGMVMEKSYSKNDNLILTVEDPSGSIKVVVNKNRPEMFEACKDIVYDEVMGFSGMAKDTVVFANSVFWPDTPIHKEIKTAPTEAYAVFLSDLHVGSKDFLPNEFERFLSWINGEAGDDKQRDIASKIQYVFIVGDLVDGVGVYPGQEEDLEIKDIKEQYSMCADYLRRIPNHMQIMIIPGNHDAMRLAEPQPALYKDFASPLYDMPNVIMLSNPSMVNIAAEEGFSGIDVLLYHGYSFDYYFANVDSIRLKGGYDRADLIMKFLLQRRHLAPTHASTVYVPNDELDALVVDKVPDIFATGHIHKSSVSNYRGITLLSGSCWQGKTAFQEKVGHNPEPCRVPIINLKTRDVKILKFN